MHYYKGSELVIDKDNKKKLMFEVDDRLFFRNDQDFNNEYILAGSTKGLKVYLFKKITDSRFELIRSFTYPTVAKRIISCFINDFTDVYWIDGILYDKNHNKLFKLSPPIAAEVNYYANSGRFLTHIKNNIFISFKEYYNMLLLSEKKKILFLSRKQYNPANISLRISFKKNELIFIDDMFDNFKVTENLLQRLRQLETVDQMKQMIMRDLAMNVI